jgi:ABC-type uncharacterized transport system ATPase subunit
MKILYGLYSPDEGEVFVDGERAEIRDPKDAVSRGIGMVHQHFTLIPALTSPRTSCSAPSPAGAPPWTSQGR